MLALLTAIPVPPAVEPAELADNPLFMALPGGGGAIEPMREVPPEGGAKLVVADPVRPVAEGGRRSADEGVGGGSMEEMEGFLVEPGAGREEEEPVTDGGRPVVEEEREASFGAPEALGGRLDEEEERGGLAGEGARVEDAIEAAEERPEAVGGAAAEEGRWDDEAEREGRVRDEDGRGRVGVGDCLKNVGDQFCCTPALCPLHC